LEPTTTTLAPTTTTLAPTTTTPEPAGTYYVDLSQTDPGLGTELSPFNYTQYETQYNLDVGDTFILKGSKYGISDLLGTLNTLQAWNLTEYGPWRMGAEGAVRIDANVISGGIIMSYEGLILNSETVSNMYLNVAEAIDASLTTVNGCTIFAEIYLINHKTCTYKDCIINQVEAGDTQTYNKCVFSCADWGTGTKTNCQFSWTAPSWPAWNAARSAFDEDILSVGINKPSPWEGNSPYTGYATGLWGTARTGIGAMDFIAATTTTEAPTTTTEAPTTTTTTTTTEAPTATYVNLDLAGTGGSGTELDPFYAENFITMLETGVGVSSGDVFRISGAYDNAAKELIILSSLTDIILQGNPIWRMNVALFNPQGSLCERMILDASISSYMRFALSCCFIKSPTTTIYSTEPVYIKGCTFIGDISLLKRIPLYATDSIFDSLIYGSFTNFYTDNCVFTGTDPGGTHTGPQWNWIPPSWPDWNATLYAFNKAVLNYGTILSSGTPPYTDYNFDLSNHSRDSIGAYASEPEPTTTPAPSPRRRINAVKNIYNNTSGLPV
jgi:hypothetical protein